MINRLLIAALATGLALLGGCTNSNTLRDVTPPTEAFAATRVFTGDGTPSDWDAVKRAAYDAEAVIIAEQHGHPLGLSAAAALWREVLAMDARKNLMEGALAIGLTDWAVERNPALALEFFERDQFSALRRYQDRRIDEEQFLKLTGKTTALTADDPWSTGYPPGHRDMVSAAMAAKPRRAPVMAANAPRRLVRQARLEGYGPMSVAADPPVQRENPAPLAVVPRFANDTSPPDNKYWRDFLAFMDTTPEKYAASTAEERQKVDGMFRAQSVWDATMADTVVSGIGYGYRPIFLVVGQFHADFAAEGGGGTVQEMKAARPETKVVVVSFQDADPAGGFRAEDKGRADFVVYCGPHPSTAKL